MLLDVSLPTGYVTGLQVFKFKWHMAVQEVLGFSNINDVKNGLLLAHNNPWPKMTHNKTV